MRNGYDNGDLTSGAGSRTERVTRSAAQGPAGDVLDKRQLPAAPKSFHRGVFSVRLPDHLPGLDGRIVDAFNEVIERNERLANELRPPSRPCRRRIRSPPF